MRQSLRVLIFACALALAACSARAPSNVRTTAAVSEPAATVSSVAAANPLILVSIDGYRPDYLQRGLSPNLEALADRGVRAQWMTPSFPTLTFPNHYTLVTGLYPDHHGIVANEMEDPSIQPDHHFTLKNRVAVGDGRW
ncbi:MAG TPA: alkaline phosphatase family protein, partial [Rhodanobacteraceae bacterium]